MQIINLLPNDERAIEQVAALLVKVFAPHAWSNLQEALEEVQESFRADRISRVAVDDNGEILGWIGGFSQYDGNVWQLHPLVVKPERQGQGIGRQLVEDFEDRVREQGGLIIFLGTDDLDNQTTLSGVNLFPNVLEHLLQIRNLRRHPYEFYQNLGFVIVGVMPDANGYGKPDIFMVKQVTRR